VTDAAPLPDDPFDAPAAPPPIPPALPRDRWAHRRVEPRLLAFLWTMYLFAATGLTLASVRQGWYITPDVYRPAARVLLASLALGVTVLWPMVRLSQEPWPGRQGPATQATKDLIVILMPAHAVIWPQAWLTGWPLEVVAALAAAITAWAVLTGGILTVAQAGLQRAGAAPTGATRAVWMLIFIVIAFAGTLGAAISGPALDPRVRTPARADETLMLSPVTAVFELARDRSYTGRPAAVVTRHWVAIGVTAAAAVVAWGAGVARSRGVAGRPGLH
jgi:hypothetical protein